MSSTSASMSSESGTLHAIITAAIVVTLEADEPAAWEMPNPWARAARPDEGGAGSPWPVTRLTWAEAERPR